MTTANKYREKYDDVNDLMNALDRDGITSEQDYDKETTTWYFDDGSFLEVCGTDVTTGLN